MYKQQCAFPCEQCEEQTSVHLGCRVLADFYKKSKYAVSIEQVLGSDCALLCEVLKKNTGTCLLIVVPRPTP